MRRDDGIPDLLRFRQIQSHRLLTEQVLARPRHGDRMLAVQPVRGRDDNGIHLLQQFRDVGDRAGIRFRREAFGASRIRVGDSHDARSR
jgi:hypothetical protein